MIEERLNVQSTRDVCDVVMHAAGQRQTIEITAGGTKRRLGRPVDADLRIDVSGLSGVTLYEPAELVVAAKAGTPLKIITDLLAQQGQMLPFEPGDLRLLLGSTGEPTLGGIVASNLSGPRRMLVGACRDALIGCKFVNGRGEEIVSGGRVMKNVTGYDIGRAMAGAYGTLGVLTELSFKVLPRPQSTLTLVFDGLSDDRAVAVMSAAVGSPFEIAGAAHLPAEKRSQTCLRLEGFGASLTYRASRLAEDLYEFGTPRHLMSDESKLMWDEIGDVRSLADPQDNIIWRLMVPPSRSAAMVASIRAQSEARGLYDWAGGLVWLSMPPSGDGGVRFVRGAAKTFGGHATLIRASDSLRRMIAPIEPPSPAEALLAKGLKQAFDPAGILNPGRMYSGV